MSTYTLTGVRVNWNSTGESANAAAETELVIYAPDTTTGFTYDVIYYDGYTYEPGDFYDIDVNTTIYGFDLNGIYYPETDSAGVWENSFGRLVWGGGTTYILDFYQPDTDVSYIFAIGGAQLPTITNLAQFNNFFSTANFSASGAVTSGAYSEGNFISFTGAPGVVVGPTIIPTDPDQVLTGTLGGDTLQGGTGDDTINPLSNTFDEDRIDGSIGDDLIIYSDSNLDSWQVLAYNDFDGITANIDGSTNTATVDKGGALGVDTITDVIIPLDWDSYGFGLFGSAGDDTFNLTIADYQWMDVRGGAGNNTYNIDITGLVRISYHWDGANAPTSGIVANLRAGTVSNNGYGGHDTINITDNGGQIQLRGTDFGDSIIGSDMDDAFILRGGDDTLDGGAGADEVRYDRGGYNAGVVVDLDAGTATGNWNSVGFSDTLSNIENVRGSYYDDDLTGDAGDNMLRGRSGNDSLTSTGGNDTLMGEDGNDTYFVNLAGSGSVLINDYSGSDTLVLIGPDGGETGGTASFDGTTFTFVLDGGRSVQIVQDAWGYTSVDTVVMTDESGTFSESFELLTDSAFATQSNMFVVGTDGVDNFVLPNLADSGDAFIYANAGNDYIELADNYGGYVNAGGDDDTIVGGAGDDWIIGGLGADVIDGGAGIDTVDFSASQGRVLADFHVDSRNLAYTVYYDEGAAEGDTFANVENLIGGQIADDLRGSNGDNVVWGGNGWDRTYGRAGDDTLYGEAGGDKIYGNAGADVMSGGDDTVRDRFIYFRQSDSGVGAGNRDVIIDFDSSVDRIEISRLDADLTLVRNQVFDFVGDAGLSGVAGELAYVHIGGDTIVQADVNGDGIADFEIELTGIMDLTADNFVL